MMYHYMELPDGTEVVHSHLIKENNVNKVIVNFERPTNDGFDTARCELPSYKWINIEGYSKDEITFFEKFLENNAHLLMKFASIGGNHIA